MFLESPIETVTMWCPLEPAEADMVEKLSAEGFSADKIAVVLMKNKRLFLRDFRTPGTDVFKAYQKGILLADSAVSAVLLQNAQKGNLTAIQQLEKKREEQRVENLREKLFNSAD